MKAHDIIEVIEKKAPLYMAAPWDNSGVQLASFSSKIIKVAVMLDPSPVSVANALKQGANFLLTHHPLSMQPRFLNKADDYLAVVTALLTHKAWLYSAHTSLDANPEGPVRWLAKALGMQALYTLEEAGTDATGRPYGFGFVGNLSEPLAYDAFVQQLCQVTGKKHIAVCGPRPEFVRRVACCPGSGGSMFERACALGADVFITGDIKYHAALEAPVCGMDVGHFSLEQEMMRLLALELEQELHMPVVFIPAFDPLEVEGI